MMMAIILLLEEYCLEEEHGSQDSPLFDFTKSCLPNKHRMVVYEAASFIVSVPGCSAKEQVKVLDNKNTHTLLLAGVFQDGHEILVHSQLLLLDAARMQMTARSLEKPVDIILASVG